MSTFKTNEQMLRALLKDLGTLETAILVERLTTFSNLTRNAITENPDGFRMFGFQPAQFLAVCDKIDKHLKTD